MYLHPKNRVLAPWLLFAFLASPTTVLAASVESELKTAEAEAQLSQGDATTAKKLLEQALMLDSQNERARLVMVRALVSSGDPDAALEQLDVLLEIHPEDPSLLREQGYIYLLQGDAMWAMQTLMAAAEKNPQDDLAQLYLGYAALTLEVPEDAVDPLDQATDDPQVGSQAQYLKAVALTRSGDLEGAWSTLDDALEAGMQSSPHAQAARKLKSALHRELIPFPLFTISLGAGLQYDSNVALFTQDIAQVSGGDYDSFGAILAGSFMLRPLRGRTWAIGGGGSILQTFNFNERVQDFNTTLYNVKVEIAKIFDDSVALTSLKLRYLQSLVCLWGGDLVDFNHYYRFSNSYGADATAEFAESTWGMTRVRLLWRRAIFTDYGRDNTGFVASLNQTFFMWGRRFKLAVEASLKVEHAQSLAWNQIAPRVFLGASLLAPWELQILAGFSYEREDHLHSGPDTRWGRHRVDDVLIYSIGLLRTFLDQIDLGVSLSYTDNRSTLTTTYDYDRWVVSINFGWRKS